jgi:hypothetical protein
MEPMIDVTHESIQEALTKNTKPSSEFVKTSEGKAVSFNTIRQRKPNTSEMRHIYASAFAEIFCNWAE